MQAMTPQSKGSRTWQEPARRRWVQRPSWVRAGRGGTCSRSVLAAFLVVGACLLPLNLTVGQERQDQQDQQQQVQQDRQGQRQQLQNRRAGGDQRADDKPKFSEEEVFLTTKDQFQLSAMWYQGELKKSAAAVLLLHDLGRDGREMQNLATFFAANGHCVLVPDLRGHGKSAVDAAGNRFQPTRWGARELLLLQEDIEACKKFLILKNDEEVCNIELMMIVACGASNIPALSWSVLDWSYAPAAVKQGQDVKGLIMLSPVRSHHGLQVTPLLRTPLISGRGHPKPLEIMIVAGGEGRQNREARGIYSVLSNHRGRRDEADDWERHNLFLFSASSGFEGIDLVERHADWVPDRIMDFLEFRILRFEEEYGHHKRSRRSEAEPPPPILQDRQQGGQQQGG